MSARAMMLVALSLLMACREGAVPADQPATVEPTFTDSTWSADSSLVAWVVNWASQDSSELWLGYRDGREAVLLDGRRSFDGGTVPVFETLTFTLNGERLLARAPFSVVTHQLIVIDLETFELDDSTRTAYEIKVIPRGRYAGYVALLQGRFYEDVVGRQFEWWLFTPEIEQVRKIAYEGEYDAWAAKHIPPR